MNKIVQPIYTIEYSKWDKIPEYVSNYIAYNYIHIVYISVMKMNWSEVIISGIILLALDSIYLTTFGGFFNNLINTIQGSKIKFRLSGAIMCYILIIFGLNYFVIQPHKPVVDAAILGFIIYGVYETTNYTIIDKWRSSAVIIDTVWGAILFALTTYITYMILPFTSTKF